jgi:hypothetical protein
VDAEAERVPRRTGEDGEDLVAVRIVRRPACRPTLPAPERQREFPRRLEVIDVEVQVDLLLLRPSWPVRPAGGSGPPARR